MCFSFVRVTFQDCTRIVLTDITHIVRTECLSILITAIVLFIFLFIFLYQRSCCLMWWLDNNYVQTSLSISLIWWNKMRFSFKVWTVHINRTMFSLRLQKRNSKNNNHERVMNLREIKCVVTSMLDVRSICAKPDVRLSNVLCVVSNDNN